MSFWQMFYSVGSFIAYVVIARDVSAILTSIDTGLATPLQSIPRGLEIGIGKWW